MYLTVVKVRDGVVRTYFGCRNGLPAKAPPVHRQTAKSLIEGGFLVLERHQLTPYERSGWNGWEVMYRATLADDVKVEDASLAA